MIRHFGSFLDIREGKRLAFYSENAGRKEDGKGEFFDTRYLGLFRVYV
jgi:hypothetical protein